MLFIPRRSDAPACKLLTKGACWLTQSRIQPSESRRYWLWRSLSERTFSERIKPRSLGRVLFQHNLRRQDSCSTTRLLRYAGQVLRRAIRRCQSLHPTPERFISWTPYLNQGFQPVRACGDPPFGCPCFPDSDGARHLPVSRIYGAGQTPDHRYSRDSFLAACRAVLRNDRLVPLGGVSDLEAD